MHLNQEEAIESVPGIAGYLGLVLTTDCPDLKDEQGFSGGKREMGHAMLPHRSQPIKADDKTSPFGMVHADLDDPYLGPWIKTLTWNTTSADWWQFEMEKRTTRGFTELPIMTDKTWSSDDSKPVSAKQLAEITKRAGDYFQAYPQLEYWETGIEENLTSAYKQRYYWSNLAAKAKAVRDAARSHAPKVKLIYQIATVDADEITPFLKSKAARYYSILTIHPYAWPDFPAPDRWMAPLIAQTNKLLRRYDHDMPIWFTEVGAPHHGAAPGEFFGYPAEQLAVTGLTRYQSVNYLLKIHATALHAGVKKLFWYNYRDRDFGNDYAENFFGMVDYWGYPKPVYVAYARMQSCLNGLEAGRKILAANDLTAYEFSNGKGRVYLVWNTADNTQTINLDELGISTSDAVWIGDPMGNKISPEDHALRISREPVYIATGESVSACEFR